MAETEGELTGLDILNVDDSIEIRMGDSRNIVVNALYSDGSVRAVTDKAVFTIGDESVAHVSGTKLLAVSEGTTSLAVSYTSEAGLTCSLDVAVTVLSPFPLTEDMFNPSIWETGSFDQQTRTLITGQYGFGGWQYAEGLDISAFSRLTVRLGNDNDSGVSFRLFDKNNYWSDPAAYDFMSSREITIDLHDMKDRSGNRIDPSHLYIVGFWSYGGKPIVIDSLVLE